MKVVGGLVRGPGFYYRFFTFFLKFVFEDRIKSKANINFRAITINVD